jgi:hypothetical protein
VNSNTVIYEVRKAEEIFQALVSRSQALGSTSNDRRFCSCTLKELAEQVGLTVRELHEKLRLLRSCRMIHTFRASDGYAFFLNAPFAFGDQSRHDYRNLGGFAH